MIVLTKPCVQWTGRHRKEDGRPIDGQSRYVYRVKYEEVFGPIPSKFILHHVCDNSWCIEPTHLNPMPQNDHIKEHGLPGSRGQANKTHCPQNHEYNQKNTYYYATKDGFSERHCRICRLAAKKRFRGMLWDESIQYAERYYGTTILD